MPRRFPSLGFAPSVGEMKTVIPHSAFPERAPGRSGLVPLLECGHGSSLPVCRKNLAHGEVFTIRFLFPKGLVFYLCLPTIRNLAGGRQ